MALTLDPTFHARRKLPLRFGLIGVTGYGLAHYTNLNELVDMGIAEWAGATVINPDEAPEQMAFFKQQGIPVYPAYEQMLAAEKMDWVCIPTGIGWHTQMTVDCLKVGLPVLVEKPLAPTLQDVRIIQQAEEKYKHPVCVGFQYLYQEDVWNIKECILNGTIGEVEQVDCIGLWPRPQSYYQRNNWAGKLHDGYSWILDSPIHNALSHIINLILFWCGPELGKSADLHKVSAELYRFKPIESYDTVRTEAQFDTGLKAAVILSHSSRNSIEPEIRITGSKGVVRWRFQNKTMITVDGKTEYLETQDLLNLRSVMFKAVAEFIVGKPARICTAEMAKGTVKWINAIQDVAPICEPDSKYQLSLLDENEDIFVSVEDLEYFALKSFTERKSFLEVGAPWAVSAREEDVSGYTDFKAKWVSDSVSTLPEAIGMESR